MFLMEFDGVEKKQTNWWTSKSQKKEKGCVCVAWRRGTREILAE